MRKGASLSIPFPSPVLSVWMCWTFDSSCVHCVQIPLDVLDVQLSLRPLRPNHLDVLERRKATRYNFGENSAI
ncbi:hypothetical protein M501DRAFT_996422 [Patellaria atrata CBS 101060]|uniref:Uncharacterized protein n=1 Tax=Patellaria atrata CBS 101060 TaxID=1346257 RepID=A0A9P4VKU9_9PEZI|nr:hypothetical protein M501DRAFT_996422 [Patellaria atrata CBS 101060]